MRKIFIIDLMIITMRACIYLPNALTLSEESAIPMTADEDAVDHIPSF